MHLVGRPKHHDMIRQPTHTTGRHLEAVRGPAIRLRADCYRVVHARLKAQVGPGGRIDDLAIFFEDHEFGRGTLA